MAKHEPRLKWSGNIEAQRIADEAFGELKDKPKPVKRSRNKRRRKRRRTKLSYDDYIRSDAWRRKRAKAIAASGGVCGICYGTKHLQVHHLNYRRLGRERDSDLKVLCDSCHESVHEFLNDIRAEKEHH